MTPPLTPSSSFASSAGNDTDGESGLLLTPPSEPASPCPVRCQWGLDVPAFRNPSIAERNVSTDNLVANFASLRIPSHDDETPKVEKTLRLDFAARPHDFDSIQPKVDLIFSRNEPAPTTFIAVRDRFSRLSPQLTKSMNSQGPSHSVCNLLRERSSCHPGGDPKPYSSHDSSFPSYPRGRLFQLFHHVRCHCRHYISQWSNSRDPLLRLMQQGR